MDAGEGFDIQIKDFFDKASRAAEGLGVKAGQPWRFQVGGQSWERIVEGPPRQRSGPDFCMTPLPFELRSSVETLRVLTQEGALEFQRRFIAPEQEAGPKLADRYSSRVVDAQGAVYPMELSVAVGGLEILGMPGGLSTLRKDEHGMRAFRAVIHAAANPGQVDAPKRRFGR